MGQITRARIPRVPRGFSERGIYSASPPALGTGSIASSILTWHKIPMPTFCRICDKRLAWAFRVFDGRSFAVVVRASGSGRPKAG
jgi:hypothetical protein